MMHKIRAFASVRLACGLAASIAGTESQVEAFTNANWISIGGLKSEVAPLATVGSVVYAGEGETGGVWQWSGSAWVLLSPGLFGGPSALAVFGGTLYAGALGSTGYAAQWTGTNWSVVASGLNSYVYALAVSGTNLYVGGSFTKAGTNTAVFLAVWNGTTWSPVGTGLCCSGQQGVYALAASGTNLYVGGSFSLAGGHGANNIAVWNGNSWSALGSGVNGAVWALATSDGGTLYAGGGFSTAGGNPANSVAAWNGTNWSALGSGLTGTNFPLYGTVTALAVSARTLYAGGYFTSAGGSPANHVAAWDGTNWSALGSGVSSDVYALATSGPYLYVGGAFTNAGGKASTNIAEAIVNPGNWLTIQANVPGPQTNTLSYVGVPGSTNLLHYTTSLQTGPWVTLATNMPATNGIGMVQDTGATDAQRFYRITAP